jgi:hypothetical protein
MCLSAVKILNCLLQLYGERCYYCDRPVGGEGSDYNTLEYDMPYFLNLMNPNVQKFFPIFC